MSKRIKLTDNFPIKNLNAEQFAWLAGLFQGESYLYLDERVRAKSSLDVYMPARTCTPPPPQIKIEMIEKDLMNQVGKLTGKKAVEQRRRTTADNKVYRVNITSRAEVEVFLRGILPYVTGDKTREKISRMLAACDQYNVWEAAGGRSNAARIANKASQAAKRQNRLQAQQTAEQAN